MAVFSPSQGTATLIADNASDYGSDLDDATALDLLSQAESQPLQNVVLESIEEPSNRDDSLQQRISLRLSRLRESLESASQSSSQLERIVVERQMREASVEVEYDEVNRVSFSPSNPPESLQVERAVSVEPEKKDTRSPLARFRKPPKKPLSVTDLVSPAWCEQQYEYSLTKYGRVRRTPAMKQGSSVHKELEEQVHVEVPIEVVTKEDRFGLRIWNAIQGLRTLRETGLTRELEVWGVLEGEVIIGIIDEISTTCSDENMEAAVLEDMQRAKTGDKRRSVKSEQLPPDQKTLKDFLTGSQNGPVLESNPAFLGTLQQEGPLTYYIKDIKTRQSKTLPAPGSPSRPTHMQLMLYHLLLSSLASNQVRAEKIFDRYNLDAQTTFSDKFIAEIANLDIASYASTNEDGDVSPRTSQRQDPLTELLEHNTLSSLWSLLISESSLTLPINLSRSPISPLLTAEFRTASRKQVDEEVFEAAGTLIGQRSFPFDAVTIDNYIKDEMSWWKGERETKGVEIEEAFKCRMCEFADGCTWRATKVEEGLRKAKLRGSGRKRSEV